MARLSNGAFVPIHEAGWYQRTVTRAAPVAVRRERGVDLSRFYDSELQAYRDAGPKGGEEARRVRAQILDRRGGVLPFNWTLVEHYKDCLDMKAKMSLKAKT